MNAKRAWLIGTALLSVCVLMFPARAADGAGAAQNHKPVMITRFFTGPDGLTHAQEIDVTFAPGGSNDVYKLLANSDAAIRRSPPGRVNDYHTASRRQYVITLSGHAELVLSGGQTIEVGPGSIELAEDLTGKGHITRTVGTEDRIAIVIPVSDK
jgi:quercetin dioxygenase-like cupin family protein